MGWKDELKKGQKFMRDAYMFANTGKLPDKKSNPNSGKLDLGHLRAEAERNGFNPLTVLRATGGQGSRYSNEPARLSSGDFWKVFNDKTTNQNNDTAISNELVNDDIRLIDPKLSNSIAVKDPHVTQSKIMYRPSVLQEETVTSQLSNGMQITTDDKVKSIIGMTRDRFGKIHYHPWIEWEIDQMATQLAGNTWFEATHWRDKALKAIGKFFTAKKTDKISKQQIRDIVNARKITNNIQKIPQLSTQQYKTIRGVTNNARKTQDEINGFVRSDY